MAATEDYGLVVAINEYKNDPYAPLEGAKGDAADFIEWLKSPQGGDLPAKNVDPYTFLSDAGGNEPLLSHLYILLQKIRKLAPQGKKRVGRRLYVFLAGHGVSPNEQIDEAGLVTVEAEGELTPYLPGKLCADGFCNGARFDEVLLFMDCCRVSGLLVKPLGIPVMEKPDPVAAGNVPRFYAFATSFGKTSRETLVDGSVRGIFSRALITGLKGGAADGSGRLTTSSLRAWLEDKLKIKVDGEEQKPQFPASMEIVLREGFAPKRVAINVKLKQPVNRIEVLDGSDFEPVNPENQTATAEGQRFWLPAAKTYLLQAFDAAGIRVSKTPVKALWEDVDATL